MNIHFEDSYFVGENREGFYVPPLMKRTWAAMLEVLTVFDDICKKNDICYYLGYGTLLGAVRHKGFIPWDDDIDVWMMREEAMKLNALPAQEFAQYGLELRNAYRDSEFANLVWQLDNGRTLLLDEDNLKKYHFCPFHLGVDILVLDYIPRDKESEDIQDILCASANTLSRKWEDAGVSQNEKEETYDELCDVLGVRLSETIPPGQRLMMLSDIILSMYGKDDGDYVAHIPIKQTERQKIFKPEWFGKPTYLSFEGIDFPAPSDYTAVLKTEFGEDYMIPKRIYDTHAYPFYKGQYAKLLKLFEENGVECPQIFLN